MVLKQMFGILIFLHSQLMKHALATLWDDGRQHFILFSMTYFKSHSFAKRYYNHCHTLVCEINLTQKMVPKGRFCIKVANTKVLKLM